MDAKWNAGFLASTGAGHVSSVVTACSTCNARKGNHLPEELGMHPVRPPGEPHFVHLAWAVRRLTPTQAKYIRLFYGAEILADRPHAFAAERSGAKIARLAALREKLAARTDPVTLQQFPQRFKTKGGQRQLHRNRSAG